MAIIDPVYSFILIGALIAGWRRGWESRAGLAAALLALTLSTSYLFYCWHLNRQAKERVRTALADEGLRAARIDAYPTLLQPYLRRVVVRNGAEVRVGWMSLWNGRSFDWERFDEPSHSLIDATRETRLGRIFEWFAMGQTSGSVIVSAEGSDVLIGDLRYGVPGAPRRGLWGIRARFDHGGRLIGAVQRVHYRPPGTIGSYFRRIIHATFN